MNTVVQPPESKKAKPVAIKEDAMNLQKEMINANYMDLAHGALAGPQGRRDVRAGQPE